MTVLDARKPWKFDEKSTRIDGNVLRLRVTLAVGLKFLFDQVRKIEDHIQTRMPPSKYKYVFVGAAGDWPPPEALALIESSFHWYAVSACNYVRMTGWLAAKALYPEADSRKFALDYVEETIPQVKRYRDKVAAHLSSFDPKGGGANQDNQADLFVAPLPVALCSGRYRVGTYQAAVRRSGKASQSQHGMDWSLTETHQELAERYGWTITPANEPKSSSPESPHGQATEGPHGP